MAGPEFWRSYIRFDPPPADGLWRDYYIDSTARWPAPVVRTPDESRAEPRVAALVLEHICRGWAGATPDATQGVLL